jgi:hypothetical protein
MSVVARVPVEDAKLFDEAMRVVHEVFTPRDLEDEVKRVIQRGIMTKPAVIAALAYFLCRSRNTQTYSQLNNPDVDDNSACPLERVQGRLQHQETLKVRSNAFQKVKQRALKYASREVTSVETRLQLVYTNALWISSNI